MSPLTSARRWLAAPAVALAGLAAAPAAGFAAQMTFGSDLTAPANVDRARQADTAYWQTTFADGRSPVAPASGQITSFRLKGIALSNPRPGVVGGETMFHLQALRRQPDGTFLILRTSQAFFVPPNGTDPQTITTYDPINFCIETGEVVVFNTVGGWDGIVTQTGPYPGGTRLQIFSRVPNALVSWFEGADRTNNGDVITATSNDGDPKRDTTGLELLMQMTVGTGPDATPLCPGGTKDVPPPPPPPGPPAPPPAPTTVQKATIPAKQKVTVSKKGKLSVSVFCLPGSARCVGKVRISTKGASPKLIGSASYNVAPKTTGHATIFLTKNGRRLFSRGRGKLAVSILAETHPGGASRRSTLATTLRRRGS